MGSLWQVSWMSRLVYLLIYAAHISSSGNDLVALTTRGCLVIVRDFERLITKEDSLADVSIKLDFRPPSNTFNRITSYLGFENGKIGVATVSCDVY